MKVKGRGPSLMDVPRSIHLLTYAPVVNGGAFPEDQIKGESRGDREGERAGSLTPLGLGSPLVNIRSGF